MPDGSLDIIYGLLIFKRLLSSFRFAVRGRFATSTTTASSTQPQYGLKSELN